MIALIDTIAIWFPGALALLALICASGFFSGSETAIFYLSRAELRQFSKGKSSEQIVAALAADADRLLTAVLFWNLLINLSYFAVSGVIAKELADEGQTAAAGFFTVGSLLAIILFGEVLPKSLSIVFRKKIAILVSWPLAFSIRVLDPVIPLLQKISRLMRRTFWPHIQKESYLHSEDLERAVDASGASEEVIRHERQILHNILDLSEILVEEAMRPRGTYLTFNMPLQLEDLTRITPNTDYIILRKQGVDSEEIDRIISLSELSSFSTSSLNKKSKRVIHVPWCSNLADVYTRFQAEECNFASVVDEYGETIGIVAFDDIIDTILSPEPSRARRILRRDPVREVEPGVYHVEGITTLRYLCRKLQQEYEIADDGLLTVAGMFHEKLERIPEVGDVCDWQGYQLEVIEVRKLGHLVAELKPQPPVESEAEED
ncbi:CNNM domain-containing protein [Gimesia chilikensis]|uniref:Magnesium and cobalt efflux protein CorC n=1 Tax=Gimesia chilikensis TaxID=2605989 RepID=A0A517W795_9PLAN|nr:CNNM domain-containing protein [Gimesia chilikensis]QDU01132.1 Magnesium and cobalt efflux protein CorC [Gimesia chilikensis]